MSLVFPHTFVPWFRAVAPYIHAYRGKTFVAGLTGEAIAAGKLEAFVQDLAILHAIGIKLVFKTAKWPENLKASRAGKLMMWGVAWGGTSPDGSYFLDLLYGPNKGQANHARFDLPQFNALFERQFLLPDGPEREALIRQAKLLAVAYMPYKVNSHRIATDLLQPKVVGYRRHPFMREFWRYIDIESDTGRTAAATPP